MPKWKSPLFSDIRNAIGDNVVFSQWKGRPFFRSYVIPANPNTLKQQANREDANNLVKRWQDIQSDHVVDAAWNESALPYLISGYNLFVKYGRLSAISVSPTSGGESTHIHAIYTCGIPVSKAKLYVFNGTTWTDKTPAEGLSPTPNTDYDMGTFAAGTYEAFLAFDDPDTAVHDLTKEQQAITKWKRNYSTGHDVANQFVITA